jgi:hypothetical protein
VDFQTTETKPNISQHEKHVLFSSTVTGHILSINDVHESATGPKTEPVEIRPNVTSDPL